MAYVFGSMETTTGFGLRTEYARRPEIYKVRSAECRERTAWSAPTDLCDRHSRVRYLSVSRATWGGGWVLSLDSDAEGLVGHLRSAMSSAEKLIGSGLYGGFDRRF